MINYMELLYVANATCNGILSASDLSLSCVMSERQADMYFGLQSVLQYIFDSFSGTVRSQHVYILIYCLTKTSVVL